MRRCTSWRRKPELGIKDPYSLTATAGCRNRTAQKQKANIGEYWADYTKEVQAFESGTTVIGTSWQVIANTIDGDAKIKVGRCFPRRARPGGRTPG